MKHRYLLVNLEKGAQTIFPCSHSLNKANYVVLLKSELYLH